MNGQEAIIAEIIGSAEKAAAGLIAEATAERDAAIESVRNAEARKKNDAIAAAEQSADAVLARRKTLCNLEARKTELAAKQQMLDAAFAEVMRKTLNMTDHIYRTFMGALIKQYADDGDRVIVAKRDEKRLHAEWLKGVSDACGKRLTLADETHDGNGGVILAGKQCDKNVTLETLINELRERLTAETAKRLFR